MFRKGLGRHNSERASSAKDWGKTWKKPTLYLGNIFSYISVFKGGRELRVDFSVLGPTGLGQTLKVLYSKNKTEQFRFFKT